MLDVRSEPAFPVRPREGAPSARRPNLAARGLGGFESGGAPDNVVYWTSSQISADMAGHVDLPDLGRVHFDDKDFPRRVRAIRAF